MSGDLRLFSEEEMTSWAREWHNMPEFEHADLAPVFSVIVNFYTAQDVRDFAALIGQSLKPRAGRRQLPSISFPAQEIGRFSHLRFVDVRPSSEDR